MTILISHSGCSVHVLQMCSKMELLLVFQKTKERSIQAIAVGTIIGRLFHRGLSRRMLTNWPLSNRQKAFRHGDGLAGNTYVMWVVKAIIKKRWSKSKGWTSPSSTWAKHLIRYPTNRLLKQPKNSELICISEAYRNFSVQLKIGGKLSHDMLPHL